MYQYPSQIERDILEALAGESPIHTVEIAATIHRHPVHVERVCIQLCEQGILNSSRRGFYELADDSPQQFRWQ
ncbi:HTH domain protein (plasmid) [Halobacterium hubeiense]|uniref:HTH domain protein n=1 Tax=Halobacterium hubeiense TaxID=1407499 RepID=A0A0U5D2J5_9EURY|nr:HTH domain protein [Halobacterium hubeiense]